MNAHRFDPVSAVLGVAATGAGAVVIPGASDVVGNADSGIWIAVTALAVGAALLPWGRRDRSAGEQGESDLVDLDA